MGPCGTRFGLLVRLAWELRAATASTVLVFPFYSEAVLYVPCRNGRREAVLAVQRDGRWLLVWRGGELEADRLRDAARRIAWEAGA